VSETPMPWVIPRKKSPDLPAPWQTGMTDRKWKKMMKRTKLNM
jgi:hypothetical protein